MNKNLGLIPIRNFAVVDGTEGRELFRSAQPYYNYEYKFIGDKLGVKHIINLRSELDHDSKMAKVAEAGGTDLGFNVTSYHVPDHHCPTLDEANEFMETIRSRQEPILFHCEHGQGRTSTFCVLAKLALGYTLEDAMDEEVDLYGYEWRHQQQKDFLINNFSNLNQL